MSTLHGSDMNRVQHFISFPYDKYAVFSCREYANTVALEEYRSVHTKTYLLATEDDWPALLMEGDDAVVVSTLRPLPPHGCASSCERRPPPPRTYLICATNNEPDRKEPQHAVTEQNRRSERHRRSKDNDNDNENETMPQDGKALQWSTTQIFKSLAYLRLRLAFPTSCTTTFQNRCFKAIKKK